MNNQKGFGNIVLIVIIVAVLAVAGYFVLSRQSPVKQYNIPKVENSQTSLKNKKASELMKLNTPIECNIAGLLEKARAERKNGEGKQVATKLFIKGDVIREEGISIFTDGAEKNTVNIINSKNKTFFSMLLDGSNRMASLDYNQIGGDQIITQYDNISPENIDCRASAFDESVLAPKNICYTPPSKSTPACYQ